MIFVRYLDCLDFEVKNLKCLYEGIAVSTADCSFGCGKIVFIQSISTSLFSFPATRYSKDDIGDGLK